MTNVLITCALTLAPLSPLRAQSLLHDGWAEIGNATYSSALFSVAFATKDVGYAVGRGGAFMKTTDGGDTWTALNTNFGMNLKMIVFTSETVGYMYGTTQTFFSTVFRTGDGGLTWDVIFSGEDKSIRVNNMNFKSDAEGWLVSYNSYYHTTDAGNSWTKTELHDVNDVWDIHFLNPDTAFMATNSSTFFFQRTTNGGESWEVSLTQFISTIAFPSPDNGYISRSSGTGIFRTTDKGQTWINAYAGINFQAESISFINDSTGFCWGDGDNAGRLFRTSDYGNSWAEVYRNDTQDINGVCLSPGDRLFAFGGGGLILVSDDGISWETVIVGDFSAGLNRIVFLNDQKGFIAGDLGLLRRTTDAGITWEPVETGSITYFNGIEFINEDLGFLSGFQEKVFKTTDGGDTWMESNNGYEGYDNFQLDMVDEQYGYIAANGGIYKTTDGAETWQHAGLSISRALQALTRDTVMASDYNILKYSYDGGETWQANSYSLPFYAMYFFNSKRGIIGDSWGRVSWTETSMENYTRVHDCGSMINDIKFISDSIGYFVADFGYLAKTIDAGNTWHQIESGTVRNLKSITFSPDGTGYIAGSDGIMLRRAVVPTYSLTFEVVNIFDEPVTNWGVSLYDAHYPNGMTTITDLVSGPYEYTLESEGYLPSTAMVVVESDTHVKVVLNADIDAPQAYDADNILDNGFRINWSNIGNARGYLLYLSSNNFETHLAGFDGMELAETAYIVNALEPGMTYHYRVKAYNTYGHSAFSNTVAVTTTNSVSSDPPALSSLLIYPNPASGILFVNTGKDIVGTVQVSDFSGRVLVSHQNTGHHETIEVDISHLPQGIYLVSVLSEKLKIVGRVIVLGNSD